MNWNTHQFVLKNDQGAAIAAGSLAELKSWADRRGFSYEEFHPTSLWGRIVHESGFWILDPL